MLTNPTKDAERLAEIQSSLHQSIGPEYAALHNAAVWLCGEVRRLTQERDSYKQASLDCHDALGKCAVERDDAKRYHTDEYNNRLRLTDSLEHAAKDRDRAIEERDTATRRVEALEAEVGRLRARFMIPPECSSDCNDFECPYIHQWTEKQDAPPAADHTERAREIFSTWMKTRPADTYQSSIMATEATRLVEMIEAALTAAERAGAEKMRALDEAVIEAIGPFLAITRTQNINEAITRDNLAWGLRHNAERALAARNAALKE